LWSPALLEVVAATRTCRKYWERSATASSLVRSTFPGYHATTVVAWEQE